MADKDTGRGSGRSQSDVLDAIFDAVEATPGDAPSPATGMFRAKALEHVNVPKQLDNLLPLTSRRRWLVLLGVAILILAGVAYAVSTTEVTAVPGSGRAVVPPGVAVAASPQAAVILTVAVQSGDQVAPGQRLSVGSASDGSAVQVVSPIAGTVWQVLQASGSVVSQGTPVVTVLPAGPPTSALFAVNETEAKRLSVGLKVTMTTASGVTVPGTVSDIASAPVPAVNAAARVALTLPDDSGYILVAVTADTPLTPGDQLSGSFVISEQTLAQRLMSGL